MKLVCSQHFNSHYTNTMILIHLVMVIVGNKVDKAEKSRQIRVDVGREYALSVSASFIECSAKTKEGTPKQKKR